MLDGAVGRLRIDGNIELHFDEAVKAATGNIVISNGTGTGTDVRTIAIDDVSQVSFEGDIVTIDLTDDLWPDSTYVLQMDSGVIIDETGHPDTSTLSSFYQTTPAILQTTLSGSNPRDGSSDFKADDDIELRFTGAVKTGVGNLVLSNGIDTRIIAIDDKHQVTFDGHNVIINPTDDLIPGTTYTAHMARALLRIRKVMRTMDFRIHLLLSTRYGVAPFERTHYVLFKGEEI
jgi:methionine-rich copper-binding protein CopC